MELERKVLKLEIERSGQRESIFLKDQNARITFGTSSKCSIQVAGKEIPACRTLICKTDDRIELFTELPLVGHLSLFGQKQRFSDLMDLGLLQKRKNRFFTAILPEISGEITVGDAKINFRFVRIEPEKFVIPEKYPGLFSYVRLKSIGGNYFKSLTLSFIAHMLPIAIIFLLPFQVKKYSWEPKYRRAKAAFNSLNEKSTRARIPEKAQIAKVKRSDNDSSSLLAMIDSKKQIRGFVRNLYYDQGQAFDNLKRDVSTQGSASTGLFTKIETVKDAIQTQKASGTGPLFASVKTSGILKKETESIDFLEGELKIEQPEMIEGTFSNEAVSQIVALNEGVLRYCYEEALIRKPKIKGRVVVLFNISPSGDVKKASMDSSTLDDRLMESCILEKVKLWRFPKPQGGEASVKYPFLFYTTKSG